MEEPIGPAADLIFTACDMSDTQRLLWPPLLDAKTKPLAIVGPNVIFIEWPHVLLDPLAFAVLVAKRSFVSIENYHGLQIWIENKIGLQCCHR